MRVLGAALQALRLILGARGAAEELPAVKCLDLVCVMWRAQGWEAGPDKQPCEGYSGGAVRLNKDWLGRAGEGQHRKMKSGTKAVSASAHTRRTPRPRDTRLPTHSSDTRRRPP